MTKCEQCGFQLYNPIKSNNLIISELGLYNDNRYPGRCILKLDQHVETLEDMDTKNLNYFMADAKHVIKVIKKVTGVERVNFSILGNTVPHVHAHLIPRYPHNEQYPNKSPWNDPRLNTELNQDEVTKLITKFNEELIY